MFQLRQILVSFVRGYTVSDTNAVIAMFTVSDLADAHFPSDLQNTINWLENHEKRNKTGQDLNE